MYGFLLILMDMLESMTPDVTHVAVALEPVRQQAAAANTFRRAPAVGRSRNVHPCVLSLCALFV